ncbi:MAG: hypothetical protein ACPL6D_00990 [Thermodesulfobacteriota bacterium]
MAILGFDEGLPLKPFHFEQRTISLLCFLSIYTEDQGLCPWGSIRKAWGI